MSMKVSFLLICVLCFCGCNKTYIQKWRQGQLKRRGVVVEYDKCEYVSMAGNLAHKGNCKYCAERAKNADNVEE